MKTTLLLSLALVSLSLNSCGTEKSNEVSEETTLTSEQVATTEDAQNQKQAVARLISQDEFDKIITEKEVTIIDVRTPEEFSEGNIPNSVNINSADADIKQKIESLDKSKPYVMYCVSGGRSGQVMSMMSEMGFQEVYNLEGGYPSYSARNK